VVSFGFGYSSDNKRPPGRLARQGSPELRWALFEAAKAAARTSSPDHDYYVEVRDRLGGKRPALSVARKLTRRCHHTLRALVGLPWITPTVDADDLIAHRQAA
jgi:transposase